MTYYVINEKNSEEVGFFESSRNLKEGGTIMDRCFRNHVIIGYSVLSVANYGYHFSIKDDDLIITPTWEWKKIGYKIVCPIEVHRKEDVQELYRKFQYQPLIEHIGGEEDDNTDAEDLNMITKMDEDGEMPF